jgi:hypothetical protein
MVEVLIMNFDDYMTQPNGKGDVCPMHRLGMSKALIENL